MRRTKLSSKEIHQKVWKKTGGVCAHCGNIIHGQKTVDHVVPKSIGGGSAFANLMPLCRKCNMHKGSKWVDIREYYKYAKEEALWECEWYVARFCTGRKRMR